ncbi:MAG: DNA-deoxyinosine glycosylase [Fibrobacter sp.]|nr:DNA-deoxyinosine glycosylase [Fibrobacter sp.]
MATRTENTTNRAHLAAGKPPAGKNVPAGKKLPAGKPPTGKNVRTRVTHEFPPVYDRDSRVLLLGSIPSPKSREVGFYYGHPQNRFWKVLAAVLGETIPETIPQKKAMLKRHHIALWDVLESCTIVGASDTSIEDAIPNKIAALVARSKVARIFCTGATAHKLYQKYCAADVGIDAVKLPSTSPANCAVSLEKLVEAYRAVL